MLKLKAQKLVEWYLYIVRCSDGSLYTGISTDITRRVKTHNAGKGAKSLKYKLPVELVYSQSCTDMVSAMRREREIKSWKRSKKLELVSSYISTEI